MIRNREPSRKTCFSKKRLVLIFVFAQSPSQHLERSKPGPGATSQLRAHALWLFALEEVERLRVEASKRNTTATRARAPLHFLRRRTKPAHYTPRLQRIAKRQAHDKRPFHFQRRAHGTASGGERFKGVWNCFDISSIQSGRFGQQCMRMG